MAADARNIEDIYELSPMQEGMLFHLLREPASTAYCEQLRFDLDGEADDRVLAAAWQDVTDRHPALRTSFQWEGLERPVQVVHRRAVVPVEHLDWTVGTPPSAERLARLAAAEQVRGFDLARAPLMRLVIVRTGAARRHVIWTHSHLLLDGWCLPLLLGEWSEACDARSAGRPLGLPPRRPYRDFIAWLRRRNAAAAGDFWSGLLSGMDGSTPVPTGESAIANAGDAAGEIPVSFSSEETENLSRMSRDQRVTLATLCQGAWALALSRLTGRDDVVFGTVAAGRPPDLAGAQEMIGLFIATLPVRVRLRPELPAGDWLRGMQTAAATARTHEHTPLVAIREAAGLPPGEDLFRTVFAFENYPAPGGSKGGLRLSGGHTQERTHYALTIAAAMADGVLSARFLYDGSQVGRPAAERAASHWQTALVGLASGADRRLIEFDLRTNAQRARWQSASANAPTVDSPPPRCWLDRFEELAALQPSAAALIGGEDTLSYAELAKLTNRAAAQLRRRGVGPGERVAVCLPRGNALIAAILSVLKAGAAYVPLDPAYPNERLAGTVEDSGAKWLLQFRDASRRFDQSKAESIEWEDLAAAAEPTGSAIRAPNPSHLAYLIYTSGSTGRPKGVMIDHASWERLTQFQRQKCGLGPGDRVLQFASIGFDASVWEITLALASGAALVSAPAMDLLPGDPLAATLRDRRISSILLPPSALAHLPHSDLPQLRVLVVGGEALWPELVARWAPGRTFVNAYGPTEATVIATWAECDSVGSSVPIGRPIPPTEALVLGPSGLPVPAGVVGELCLAGPNLSWGYWARPDLTAERFIPHPFSDRPGERLYRTGDLARWNAEGQLEFVGRLDRQVKVRGYRIELGEVEAALTAHAQVREAFVDVRRAGDGEAELVAWVVPKPGESLAVAELRSWLASRLPAHFVPGAWSFPAALPQTPGGKIDRAALPEPERHGLSPAAASNAATRDATPIETLVADAFAEVLRTGKVGPDDDFFQLGGHSLAATRLVARLRDRLAPGLALSEVFSSSTPRTLAARIALGRRPGGLNTPVTVRPAGARTVAAPEQRRFWVLDRLSPNNPASLIQIAVRVGGPLDRARLERALSALADRHEPLRSALVEQGGEVVALPAPAMRLDETQAENWEAGLRADATAGFDLGRGPLWKVRLAKIGPDEHRLGFTFHHAAFDGWSEAILLRDLGRLYAGETLPAASPTYGDYAAWQQARAASGEFAESLNAWAKELRDIPTIELPTDGLRTAVRTYRGGRLSTDIAAAVAAKLRETARSEGATLFMVLLAGWETWLWRHSGQADFGVGVPVAGRVRPEWEPLIGLFVNTLVVRSDVAPLHSFKEMIGRVRDRTLNAFDRQEVLFEQILEKLQPPRVSGRTPLFQTMFSLHNAPRGEWSSDQIALSPIEAGVAGAKFELTLTAAEAADGSVGLCLEYDSDLFQETTAQRFLDRLSVLIRDAAERPEAALRDLAWVTPAEIAEIRNWSGGACAVAGGDPEVERVVPTRFSAFDIAGAGVSALGCSETIAERFERRVAEAPEAVAICWEGNSLSYAELNARANRLARELAGRGVGPEDLVALCLPRSDELIVGLIAVAKAGAAYLPLDPEHPSERLRMMLADARPAACLTMQRYAGRFPETAERILLDETETAAQLAERSPMDLTAGERRGRLHRDLPAYVIYTSGSTGVPKGVMVTHHNATRLFDQTEPWFHFGREDVWTLFHSPTFDFSVWEIWGALLYGGRLVIVPHLVTRSPGEFLALLARERVTVLNQTPSAFYQLAAAEAETPELGARLALRRVIFGGEALALDRLAGWYARHPEDAPRLVNMYGITETTVHVSYVPLSAADAVPGPSKIGAGIPDLAVYVLDEYFRPVPAGVTGELHVAGPGLARGYLRRPELTAERFVPDPWGPPGGRMYRTGDVGRWRNDGGLDYLGRNDHQVKIRGFRIELGEIEAALVRQPAVAEAVVLARESGGAARLVAYVTARDGAAIDSEEIRRELGARLPDYMVPSALVAVDRWPLTANGKLDRRALPEPAAPVSSGGAAPQGPVEEFVAATWRDLLGAREVAREDNFFALGGHSLLATQFISRVRESLGIELPLLRLFEDPTVAGCARAAEEHEPARGQAADRARGSTMARAVAARPAGSDAPLSFAQRRLWFLDRLVPGNPAYNVVFAFRLRGPLDVERFGRSLEQVAGRQESLRTIFVTGAEGEPTQRILPASSSSMPFEFVDLGSGAEAETSALQAAEDAASRSFALDRGPLARVRVLRIGTDDHVVIGALHHLVCDGWSIRVLVREIGAHYSNPGSVEPLPAQYADYALAQRTAALGAAAADSLRWWRERLQGLPALELPADRVRPAVQGFGGVGARLQLSAAERAALAALAREEQTTLFVVVLAAFEAVLAAWSGQRDFAVGTPVAGRTRREWEPLIGFFVNTLVLRAELEGDPSFVECVRRTRTVVQDALARQDTPFDRLVEELNPGRELSHAPLVQAVLAFDTREGGRLALPGLTLEPIEPREVSAKFDVTLSVVDTGEEIEGGLILRSDLFSAASAEAMARLVERCLRRAAGAPETTLGALTKPDEAERAALERWEHGEPVSGADLRPVPEQVLEWARKTPEAAAIRAGGETVSYAQLAGRAEQLAKILDRVAGQNGNERRFAVCLSPSPGAIVAQLAAWLAGGAYLPLDPNHPADRLREMAVDAGVAAVVTDSAGNEVFAGKLTVVTEGAFESRDGAGLGEPGGPGSSPPAAGTAYVIYTSGSTGTPKGVVVGHRSLAGLVAWHRQAFELRPADSTTLLAGPGFDASVWEAWPTLASGGTLVVPALATVADPAAFRDWLAAEKIAVSFAPTPIAELLLGLEWPEGVSMRWMLTGGDRLRRRPPAGLPFRLSNNYGPTENTVVATSGEITPGDNDGLPSIGGPIAGTTVRLLDSLRRRVPAGATGEIYLGGDQLAIGYLGRPELTAEAFVADPFAQQRGARLYRTGDLARWRPDGTLDFRGRADRQVKIRGIRIELGEVEAALAALPDVAAAAAEVRAERGEPTLIAWWVPAGPAGPDEGALRTALRGRLPAAMVPARWVKLDRLPLTTSGKIDRRALIVPDGAPAGGGGGMASGAAPETPLEQTLAAIWRDVLGLADVGVDRNFFDVGGHSLRLVSVQLRLQAALGRPVPMLDLFAHPTIRALASHLEGGPAEGANPVAVAADRAAAQRAALERRRRGRSPAEARP
ncbi:MAG TPA: amino acid adenylation domain-containing protein [Opitutaceae bacterium]